MSTLDNNTLNESELSRVPIAETILSCAREAGKATSVGEDFTDTISGYLIQANGKKIPASEITKLVDILMAKIS